MKKILIVDDSAFFRSLIREDLLKKRSELSDKDIAIHEADSKNTALAKVKEESPDLIFLDIVMQESEQEGVLTLQEIKHSNPNQNVVMLTAIGQIGIMKKCKEYGVNDYLTKPYDSKHLIEVTNKYLQ